MGNMRCNGTPRGGAGPILLLLVLCAWFLTGCAAISAEIRQVVENSQDRMAQEQSIYTVRLARWTDDVPDGTLLQLDVAHDYQVTLVGNGKTELLGKLQQQLPDAPVRTILLDTGADRFIVGWIDETVEGDLITVGLGRGQTAKLWQIGASSRMFFIPILESEQQKWEQLSYIYASSRESIRRGLAGGEFNPAFLIEYAPPFNLEPLFQHVNVDWTP
jgi:hypothetical protein